VIRGLRGDQNLPLCRPSAVLALAPVSADSDPFSAAARALETTLAAREADSEEGLWDSEGESAAEEEVIRKSTNKSLY